MNAELDDGALVNSLRRLRTGFGFELSKVGQIPADARAVLHVDRRRSERDQRRAIRRLLRIALTELAEKSPDVHDILEVALNLQRVDAKWLERAGHEARRRGMSRKTYIRRTDSAFDLLAATMAARGTGGLKDTDLKERVALARLREILDRRDECRVQRAEISILVDRDRVKIEEVMTVEAIRAGAEHYVVGKSLPYKTTVVESAALAGAEILDTDQPHDHWLLELLAFTRPLDAGEVHRFVVIHDTRSMAPMWTATSFHEVDELVVRIRFLRQPYGTAYAIEDFPPKLLQGDDIGSVLQKHAPHLELDRLGEADITFRALKYNQSYGIGWTL